MQKRTLKVALLAVLSLVLVLGMSTVGLAAAPWTDLPDTVTAKYGITDNQVAGISEGYPNGLWKPYQSVTRAQFTKMAVAAFNIPLADPATASFTDVPKGSYYYPYVEGAKAAGIVNGTSATTFGLNANITRQQAVAIVARYIADAQGFDLATMYSEDELSIWLGHFGDAASIAADFKEEVAFAYDMGLTQGDNYGNFNPLANLTRIQAAAFLIRAQGLVPPNMYTPAKIELVSEDKTEDLIGRTYSATFKVTDAAGHPASRVLVDFDTLLANDFYVGNVSSQAAVTNNQGLVTVNLLSLEPGTQRVSATVAGVGTIYVTRYWLVLDEIYTTGTQTAQNNVGVEHEWEVRVVVFGPGPRSTSQDDWYNAIDADFDPTNVNVRDGVDYTCDYLWYEDSGYEDSDLDAWTIQTEKAMQADGFTPRTLAGIDVEWAIYDDDNGTPVTTDDIVSVGNIIKVDGVAITPAKTAVGKTDANGLSSIVVYSEETGTTLTEAVADYPGNPYPEQLFNHDTFDDWSWHNLDWDDQPTEAAVQKKTWIHHTFPDGEAGPITPAYTAANIGEELTLTITLTDTYGNPVAGKEVEWFMQGVGFFQTDDANDTSDPNRAANNKDFDVTNAAGVAKLYVKSYEPGEQIIHAKVRDKGTGGAEGAYMTYTAEVQWFEANVATFDDITTTGAWVVNPKTGLKDVWDEQNEAVSTNPVNTSHGFCVWVYGLKLEYAPTIDDPDGQTPFIDTDAAGSAYDGVFDAKDAEYLGGILLVNPYDLGDNYYVDTEHGVVVENDYPKTGIVAGREIVLSLVGGYTEFDVNGDGEKEPFSGQTGIYLPLEGKTATFTKETGSVGNFDPAKAVTDAAGKACVTVSSTVKGPETIKATIDWPGNPHNGPELISAFATKTWVSGIVGAESDVTIEIYIDDVKVATNKQGKLADGFAPMWTYDPETGEDVLNDAHVEVHVLDAYGNDLADYEVVYLLQNVDGWLYGSQGAADTRIPFAYLVDNDTSNRISGLDYDMNGVGPDAEEPTPASDPYAYIVGEGGTESFFFNQWLGPDKPWYGEGRPGVPQWWTRVAGMNFEGYCAPAEQAWYNYTGPSPWPSYDDLFDGFDGVYDYEYLSEDSVGLATDGAKAWTLDGFRMLDGQVVPNLLTGSNIDIQLAEGDYLEAPHYKSILRVMVYAPGDGVIREGDYIWSTQVHQVWAAPVPTTITLEPAADYAIAGMESQSLVAKVRDQFGNGVPHVPVTFFSETLEGKLTDLVNGTVYTDENGNAAIEWGGDNELGDWGVEEVVAFIDNNVNGLIDDGELKSNAAVIQWIYVDERALAAATAPAGFVDPLPSFNNRVNAVGLEQKVTAWSGYQPWDNMTLRVYLNPGGNVAGSLGSALYVADSNITISTNTVTWMSDQPFFVNAANSTNTDGAVNWVYEVVDGGTVPGDTTEPIG